MHSSVPGVRKREAEDDGMAMEPPKKLLKSASVSKEWFMDVENSPFKRFVRK